MAKMTSSPATTSSSSTLIESLNLQLGKRNVTLFPSSRAENQMLFCMAATMFCMAAISQMLFCMAATMFSHLQKLWPFSILKTDDLKLSNQLVQKLSKPENTKKFIFASREPDSNAVIYILAAQNLSKQSALDAEQLIKEVQPKAVVCLVGSSALTEIQKEEKNLPDEQANNVPTSSFGVLKKCLTDKINQEHMRGSLDSLGEIFGIRLYGHCFAAKKAAEEIGSQFILLESPYERSSNSKTGEDRSVLNLKASTMKFYPTETLQTQMGSLALPSIKSLLRKDTSSELMSKPMQDEGQLKCDYKVPPFAQSIYHVLADLHEIFSIVPAIQESLTSAQKMLTSVNKRRAGRYPDFI